MSLQVELPPKGTRGASYARPSAAVAGFFNALMFRIFRDRHFRGAPLLSLTTIGLRDAAPAACEAAEINKRMAKKMNSYKKFVFSRGGASEALAWNNAELVVAPTDEDVVRFINELKTQPGRDIHLAGGAHL